MGRRETLTSRSLFEPRSPVVARHYGQRRRALDGAERVLGHDPEVAGVVIANLGNLQYVDHAVVA